MSYAADLLSDFSLRDDLSIVTLTKADASSNANVQAAKWGLNWREVQLSGELGLQPTDQVFMLGALSLAGKVPEEGDTITTADGTNWTIASVDGKQVSDTPIFYNCIAHKQIAAIS
jgi:hypothetical protein